MLSILARRPPFHQEIFTGRTSASSRRRHESTSRPTATRFRPQLETLEDRVVPSAGDLDLSFHNDGKVFNNLGLSGDMSVRDMAVQADGKILLGGMTTDGPGSPHSPSAFLTRLNTNGTRGTSSSNPGSAAVARYIGTERPIADAGGPYSVFEGGTITLSAAGSTDDDPIVRYEWDFDFSAIGALFGLDVDAVGERVTFSAAGLDGFSGATQTVALQVFDSLGRSSLLAFATVSILNASPCGGRRPLRRNRNDLDLECVPVRASERPGVRASGRPGVRAFERSSVRAFE